MIHFTTYDSTGLILSSGNYYEGDITNFPNDVNVIYEQSIPDKQYVIDDVITDYTETELQIKNNIPYGYRWKMPERILEQYLTSDELNANVAIEVRTLRDKLLSACDWTQTLDQSEDRRNSYVVYRQALRDISKQESFPFNIVWPMKPE